MDPEKVSGRKRDHDPKSEINPNPGICSVNSGGYICIKSRAESRTGLGRPNK